MKVKILLIILVLLLSYGLTTQMYFWQDDSALIFKLQNPAGAAGSFGAGIWQRGAYQYLVVPFVPFFPLFNLNPFGYFAVGWLTYLMAAGAFYVFSREIFKEEKHAYWATLVFSSGYVSSDTMFRIINSWQTNIGLVLALFTLSFYTRFLKNRTLKLYLISLLFYLATIELVFIRSHSLVFLILILDILFSLVPFSLRKLGGFIIRTIPFLVLFKIWYLNDANFGGGGIINVVKELISGNTSYVASLFGDIGNAIIPNVLAEKAISLGGGYVVWSTCVLIFFLSISYFLYYKKRLGRTHFWVMLCLFVVFYILNYFWTKETLLWYSDIQSQVAGLVGLSSVTFSTLWAISLWKKEKQMSIAILLGMLVVVSQIFGYYTQYPNSVFPTHHRYFSHSFIGLCVWWVAIFASLPKWKYRVILVGGVVLVYLGLGIQYQTRLLKDRSNPSREFYKTLVHEVPTIQKGSVFYFDVYQDPFTQTQFGDFFSVGSMPETTALAIYYGLDRYDVAMSTDLNEVLYKLQTGEYEVDKLYSFYYDKNGLINTTSDLQNFLKNGGDVHNINAYNNVSTELSEFENGTVGKDILIEIPIETMVVSVTPYEVSMDISVKPLSLVNIWPYMHGGAVVDESTSEEFLRFAKYRKYLSDYYKRVEVETTSEWKYRESVYLADDNPDTVWQGHRIWWGDNKSENVTLDLGIVENISGLVWNNWNASLSPISYTIETSRDSKTWEGAVKKDNTDGYTSGELIVDKFTSREARFIRMNITKTITDDSPGMSEVFPIPGEYGDIDIQKYIVNRNNLFQYVDSKTELDELYNTLSGAVTLQVTPFTDKKNERELSKNLPVIIDNKMHDYRLVFNGGGTSVSSLVVRVPFPSSVEVSNVRIRNLRFDEVVDSGLIKRVSEN